MITYVYVNLKITKQIYKEKKTIQFLSRFNLKCKLFDLRCKIFYLTCDCIDM